MYIRYALSGMRIVTKDFETKQDFYCYVGKLYLGSIEKIERFSYEVKEGDVK